MTTNSKINIKTITETFPNVILIVKWKLLSHVRLFVTHELYGCGGLVSRSYQTLVTPWTVACQAPLSMGFSRQEYWSGLPFPSPGDLPNPGMEPRSPLLQVDSLPAEPQGKPRNTGVGSLPLLQGLFLTQGLNRHPLYCRWILYQLSYQRSWHINSIINQIFLSGTVVKFMYNFILSNNKRDYSYHHLTYL